MTLEQFLSRFEAVRQHGDQYEARCSNKQAHAHGDRNASLSICERNGRILLKCFRGCSVEDILAAMGLRASDLFTDNGTSPQIEATYSYTDENNHLLFEEVRFRPKDFRARRPDGAGGWVWNLDGVRRVLYHLPEVLAARDVEVCEGPKDCETAAPTGRPNESELMSWTQNLKDAACSPCGFLSASIF